MTDREPSKDSESIQHSLANRETVAPSGLGDSTPTGSGPFTALPSQFGRYRVTKLLGYGAMGTVYLAFDPELDKEVALKIPKADLARDPALWERFQREARAAGDLDFPSICGMYEIGQIDGTHYISMQYIDGRPLSEFVSDNQSPRKVAGVVRKLALGLAHAHERGIVHRDLKPANVMIDTKGDPVIMDFGLARRLELGGDVRATQSGMIVGSPAYMSPEQAKAEHDQIGPRTDIYGLGVLFFELLTGSLPFRGPMVVVLGQIATQPPPKPSSLRADVDSKLESLCLKMLEKQPQNRPSSMTEVAQNLTDWLKGGGSSPEIALREAASPTESVALTPAKSAAPPRTAKADGIDAQKQRVTDLLDKREYSAAIELLDKIVNLRDERFAPLVAWARPQLKAARATEQKLREASAPSCDTAQQLLKHYDYTGAAELLAQVPPAYRSVELRDLLDDVTNTRDECDHLQRDIEEAVRAGDTETLPALVKRLYKLRPNNKAIKQLAADLKEHGAAKVIARRKGQRRFLDPAGRVVEPQHIVWSIVLVVGLFVGVSLMVSNYLNGRKVPVPPPPQPTETDPPKTSPSVPTPIAASEPLPQTITSQSTGMKLTLIPAGTFTMGSPDTEGERLTAERPQHPVHISQPFYMGVYEVTQGEYEQVMGTNPSYFSNGEAGRSKVSGQDTSQFPVETVAWYDAIEFCNKLSAKDGRTPYYTLTNATRDSGTIKSATVELSQAASTAGRLGYRLPTEAEWEYACRAKTTTPFSFGSVLNGDKANVDGNSPYGTTTTGNHLKRTTTVGAYGANPFGLYDMHGNVWEWCDDVYDEQAYSKRSGVTPDPRVTSGSEYRVWRGGSWGSGSAGTRSARRSRFTPDYRDHNYGFRVVLPSSAARTPGDVTGTSPIALRDGPAPVVLKSTAGQELFTLKGHTGGIFSVAFSADGKRLASASRDQTLKVWDAKSGQETLTLKGHTKSVTSIAFSKDGERLGSASLDQTVKVWNVTNGQETLTLKGHIAEVMSVAFSADGKRLASASNDMTVKIWDAASGQARLTLKGHKSGVTSVAFSTDGKWLASAGGYDMTVKLWDATSGQEMLTFKGHTRDVNSVAFSADGKRLASASGDQMVKLWDATSGQEMLTLKGHTSRVTSVAFSTDGKRLASASDDQMVKVWDATSGQETLTLKGHNDYTMSVAFSPDGTRLASASSDRTVKVWDVTLRNEAR